MESAEKPSSAGPTMGDPNLNPDLRARAEAASDVMPVVLAAAAGFPNRARTAWLRFTRLDFTAP